MSECIEPIIQALLEQGPAWVFLGIAVWFVVARVWPFSTKTVVNLIAMIDHCTETLESVAEIQNATVEALRKIAEILTQDQSKMN